MADASREMKKTGSEAGSCTSSVINATHARMIYRTFIYAYEKPSSWPSKAIGLIVMT